MVKKQHLDSTFLCRKDLLWALHSIHIKYTKKDIYLWKYGSDLVIVDSLYLLGEDIKYEIGAIQQD